MYGRINTMSAYSDEQGKWHKDALAGNPVFHDDYLAPQAGFYKIRCVPWTTYIKPLYKEFEPIFIGWEGDRDLEGFLIDDEHMVAYIRDNVIHENHLNDIWQEACKRPISQEEYYKLSGEVI